MKCPACESTEHQVVSTRQVDAKVVRLRACQACRHRWPTTEISSANLSLMESAVKTVKQIAGLAKEIENGAPSHG